jgi:tetratricopeptide (TPR) repeat protein
MLREAEGYLELNMPAQALASLDRIEQAGTFRGQISYLRGEALRSLGRFGEALEPLEAAAEVAPSNIHVWLALGWCYKRTGRLDRAIKSLRNAMDAEPTDDEEALLTYNLACYLALAGEPEQALAHLAKAVSMNGKYRELAHSESDFDTIRSLPEFQVLTSLIV